MNEHGALRLAALALLGAIVTLPGPAPALAQEPGLRVETLVSGLDTPWDLAWGPDGLIWVTERGGRISRVDPASGKVTAVGEIEVREQGEAGLMGMAFHPDFAEEPWIYLAHSYGAGGGIRNRLVRARLRNGALGPLQVLLDAIPGRANHDGARLVIGPDRLLYMTTGDAGNPANAQELGSPAGKVLRMTLDGAPAPGNPFGSRVYSYGHRNAQGIVFHPRTGDLYVSEHGPGTNDEVSRVEMGKDHGWPVVHGTCDGDVRGEREYCAAHDVVEAIATWTPTIGIAGLDYYDSARIPGWRGSLLATSLRGATLWRLQLSADGRAVERREALYRGEYGRLRDVLVGPDGAVYLATSNRDGRGRPAREDDRILRIVPGG